MTKVQNLESEIKLLNRQELSEFRDWFQMFDSDAWDAKIEQDARAGQLDRIADGAVEEHGRGESKAL